ncbi:hypothetical protein [Cupriavidus consociatus]|nr:MULTISPECIES: hypothetical protein [unclassified Cupriavidus]MBP0625248.1 hypothetical protein [Cupriavidus sp. LEh25]MDK2661983.1 hypothetical protein [Cupriavidus sp. LEh21]
MFEIKKILFGGVVVITLAGAAVPGLAAEPNNSPNCPYLDIHIGKLWICK